MHYRPLENASYHTHVSAPLADAVSPHMPAGEHAGSPAALRWRPLGPDLAVSRRVDLRAQQNLLFLDEVLQAAIGAFQAGLCGGVSGIVYAAAKIFLLLTAVVLICSPYVWYLRSAGAFITRVQEIAVSLGSPSCSSSLHGVSYVSIAVFCRAVGISLSLHFLIDRLLWLWFRL